MNVIIIAAVLPLLIEAALWIVFYIRYCASTLLPLARTFKTLADKAKGISSCKKDNLNALEKAMNKDAPDIFTKRWEYMKEQIKKYYAGELIAEGGFFFPFEEVVRQDGGRYSLGLLWKCFWVFEFLSLSLPVLTALVSNPQNLAAGAASGLCAFSAIAAGQLLFASTDQSIYNKAQREYTRFIDSFNRITPVADKQSALVIEAIRRNQDSFEAGVDKIVYKFDGFAEITVLPALKESLKTISQAQEKGMKLLASDFSQRLTETLDVRMKLLSETISGIQRDLTGLNESLSENISGLDKLLVSQRSVLEEAAQEMILSQHSAAEAAERTEKLLAQSYESSENLARQMGEMSKEVENLANQNSVFSVNMNGMMKYTAETQMNISAQMKESQDKIGDAVQNTAQLMDNIVRQMKDAMAEAGKEIAAGIKESTSDNAEILNRLSLQANLLREDYDNYFTRIENSYEDMDYHVQNIIAKVSEEVQNLLTENTKVSRAVLDEYNESTENLLSAFREQANSISLYAKEINLDVSELSKNLNDSVSIFSQSLQDGVESTMRQFDSGLAELSLRIANTVESICDAVETLPAAIQSKQGNKK